MGTSRGALLVACLLVGVSTIGSVIVAQPSSACAGVTTRGEWRAIEPPGSLGPVAGAAVDPDDPLLVFVGDAQRVYRSTDGGCSWGPVLDLGDRAGPTSQAALTGMTVPAGAPGRVYATIADPGASSAMAPVLVSRNDGIDWQAADGLPGTSVPSTLLASPADPDVVYLSMQADATALGPQRPGDGWTFHASTDGGLSWEQRSDGRHRERFVPDVSETSTVWALGSASSAHDGPYISTDGGRTWTPAGSRPAGVSEPSALSVTGSHVVVAQEDPQAASIRVYRSSDGGAGFEELPEVPLSGGLEGVALGPSPDSLVVTAKAGVLVLTADGWRDIDVLELSPLRGVMGVTADQPRWAGWNEEFVALFSPGAGPTGGAPDPEDLPPPPAHCADADAFSPAAVSTSTATLRGPDRVEAEPAVAVPVDFRLELGAHPAALDTFLLLDTSESMGGALDGVVCGLERLVHELDGAGVDGRFGLGEFQDASGVRYRRLVDISPPGAALQKALRTRELEGGEETHRTALYQAATGSGLDLPGDGDVAPGQQAGFRADALPVILTITDEPYTPTTPFEPTPSAVTSALRERGIHHIGIHVVADTEVPVEGGANDALTRRQLEDFSRGAGTFAPPGGVDCDGDGHADVEAGEPLVCTVGRDGIQARLADTLVAVLLAIEEDRPVRLRVVDDAGMDVTAGEVVTVNVREAHLGGEALVLPASVTCLDEHAGTTRPLVMAADVGGREAARTGVDVACADPAPPPVPERPAPAAAAGAPVPVAPVQVPSTSEVLSGSASGASEVIGEPTLAARMEMPGALGALDAEREAAASPQLAFAVMRTAGAIALAGGFFLFVRRAPQPALAKRRRR